jgi:hypothetical protein
MQSNGGRRTSSQQHQFQEASQPQTSRTNKLNFQGRSCVGPPVRPRKHSARVIALKQRSVDNSCLAGQLRLGPLYCCAAPKGGSIMAKRKRQSKLQRRAKLRRGNSAKRGKPRKVARAAKRTVAKAKPKRTPVKEVVRKEAVAPAVETLVDTTEIREESEPKPPSLI